MSKFLLIPFLAVFCAAALFAGKAPDNWETDFDTAKKKAEKLGVPVVVLFSGTDWCPPCKMLRKRVLDDKKFGRALKDKCILLYVDVPRKYDPDFARDMQTKYSFVDLRGVPTTIITDSKISHIKKRIRPASIKDFVDGVKAASQTTAE